MFEGIKDPTTVEILYKTAVSHPPSDTHSIPLKAMWALRVIGSPEAEESLKNLCNSTNEITAKIAKQELDSLHKLKASTSKNAIPLGQLILGYI